MPQSHTPGNRTVHYKMSNYTALLKGVLEMEEFKVASDRNDLVKRHIQDLLQCSGQCLESLLSVLTKLEEKVLYTACCMHMHLILLPPNLQFLI